MSNSIIALQEVFDVLEKHKDLLPYQVKKSMYEIPNIIKIIKLQNDFGVTLQTDCGNDVWIEAVRHTIADECIGFFDGQTRKVPYPDNGRQPKNEYLYRISFPTGAYIFGDDYKNNQCVFNSMFDELKSFNPKYSDTSNHTLYFDSSNSKNIYDALHGIIEKYKKRADDNKKQSKIEALKLELEQLQSK